MPRLEEILHRSELRDAFEAGIAYAASQFANDEVLTVLGKPVQVVWPDGPPHERLLAGMARNTAEHAVRYGYQTVSSQTAPDGGG